MSELILRQLKAFELLFRVLDPPSVDVLPNNYYCSETQYWDSEDER